MLINLYPYSKLQFLYVLAKCGNKLFKYGSNVKNARVYFTENLYLVFYYIILTQFKPKSLL